MTIMNADGVMRALETQGELIIVQRLTGTKQVAFSVECKAMVFTGAEMVVIGSVSQNADRVMITDREMNAKQWPQPPRHGDRVIRANGSTFVVQGDADIRRVAEDRVYFLKTLGGG
jgi:hypothetical protein